MSTREAYLYISAMLRAREVRMLNREKAERMLDAPGFEESARLLTDCGYEDMSQMNAAEIDGALQRHRDGLFRELEQLCPDKALVDVFRIKYDYHNAKVILKAEAMGSDPASLMSRAGRVKPDAMLSAYREERLGELPGLLGGALRDGKELLARSGNPQQVDFLLDKTCYTELSAMAAKLDNDFLKNYVAALADSTNLRSAVRTIRMGKNADFLRQALVPGGKVDPDRILSAASGETLAAVFAGSALGEAAAFGAAAVEGGEMTAFERACDNAVMKVLREAKLSSYGAETVIAYLAAVENEITAVRMILTGKLTGIDPHSIRERLRDLYA